MHIYLIDLSAVFALGLELPVLLRDLGMQYSVFRICGRLPCSHEHVV